MILFARIIMNVQNAKKRVMLNLGNHIKKNKGTFKMILQTEKEINEHIEKLRQRQPKYLSPCCGAEWTIKYSGLYTPNISACSKCGE
jgi:hypothetical protein